MKILLTFLAIALAITGNAQYRQSGAYAQDRNYNPNTVTTIQGTIVAIEKQKSDNGPLGVHITVQTTSEKVNVHVGPQWYIEKQPISLHKGDNIKVEGSSIKMNGEKVIIARRIEKNGQSLELRKKDGTPLWSRRYNR